MRFVSLTRFLLLGIGAVLPAQGHLPNGDFTRGAQGWKRIRFDDPAGKTGIDAADVAGTGRSPALFADFSSPTRLVHCNWLSDAVVLPLGIWPVSFHVMWQKPAAVQIPDPSGNYLEVYVLDDGYHKVFTGHVPVPRGTDLLERRYFLGQVKVVSSMKHYVEIFMRHSEISAMPFTTWVDEISIGPVTWSGFDQGCSGSGGFEPAIGPQGLPEVGTGGWQIVLGRALAPTAAVLALGTSRTVWSGLSLPLAFGGGCRLLTGLELPFPVQVPGSGAGEGRAALALPIPFNANLRGLSLHAQWLVADPAATLGIVVTRGLTFQIQ